MKRIFLFFCLIPFMMKAQKKNITLEDIYVKNTFSGEHVAGFESANTASILQEEDDAVLKQSSLSLNGAQWSADRKHVLLFSQRESIYRRSSKAYTFLYDIASKSLKKIDSAKVLHATFSPDGQKVAYVKNNNLYVYDLSLGRSAAVTKDGRWNYVINGNCDWVYEEEFSFSKAFEWSPDSKYLAYYRFDESAVKEYNMTMYDSYYNKDYRYKYPKAGEANSVVQIHIRNLQTGADVLAKFDTGDIYIPRIQWIPGRTQLVVFWLNRHQDDLKLLTTDPDTGSEKLLYEEKNDKYVDIDYAKFIFLQNGKQLLYTSEKKGFWHLYLRDIDRNTERQLIKGQYDLAGIDGVDEKNKRIYYTAAFPRPMDRNAFVVDFNGKKDVALTHDMAWHSVEYNADYTEVLDTRSDINTPGTVTLYKVANGVTYTDAVVKGTNTKLKETLSEYDISKAEFIQVAGADGTMLNGFMLKPAHFDAGKKYPVLFCNYGGPGSQTVANRYGAVSSWHQMMAEKGFIIVAFDNRGTGYRGEAFKKSTYLQLGRYESDDQIAAAKYLATQSYVDPKRIGHWGWSFGGFMSGLAISKGADVFSFAISVAPVTSWRFYDNIYTERYMRTPQENKAGYDENAPLHYAPNIKGKYLLIHGTADDNVHFQNSVELSEALIQANIPFEQAYYPNKNHGIRGGNTSLHLWTKMTHWLEENVLKQ